jgi:hypothetical protein
LSELNLRKGSYFENCPRTYGYTLRSMQLPVLVWVRAGAAQRHAAHFPSPLYCTTGQSYQTLDFCPAYLNRAIEKPNHRQCFLTFSNHFRFFCRFTPPFYPNALICTDCVQKNGVPINFCTHADQFDQLRDQLFSAPFLRLPFPTDSNLPFRTIARQNHALPNTDFAIALPILTETLAVIYRSCHNRCG